VSEAHEPDEPAVEGVWRGRVRFWAEILNKLAIPLLGVLGTLLTLAINERNNTRATINQREQAESELRSSMFSELVNPLVEQARLAEPGRPAATVASVAPPDGGVVADPALGARADRLTLLAELLALNFHEHFELGPLLRYVEQLDGQTPENQRTLRAVARRVTGRQIAMIGRDEARPCATARDGALTFEKLRLRTVAGEPAKDLACFLYKVEDAGKTTDAPTLECSLRRGPDATRKWQPLMTVSPDCRDELTITLRELDWDRQTLSVEISVASRARGLGKDVYHTERLDFTLSPYSLPFSDNTLLGSGNRFGIYVRQVSPDSKDCKERGCVSLDREMGLSFMWFPSDFYPPRERPTDFAKVRKALSIPH
jgi:hypothetical protein